MTKFSETLEYKKFVEVQDEVDEILDILDEKSKDETFDTLEITSEIRNLLTKLIDLVREQNKIAIQYGDNQS